MDALMFAFVVAGFLAVMLLAEGTYVAYAGRFGPEAKRIRARLQRLGSGTPPPAALLAPRSAHIPANLGGMPLVASFRALVQESGVPLALQRVVALAAAMAALGLVAACASPLPLWSAPLLATVAAALPLAWIAWRRSRRIRAIEAQLPDVLGLIARCMRAGHSFQSAAQMVAAEMPDPIGTEFGAAVSELNCGVSVDDALQGLARRVPVRDLRFFVLAVAIQRDTGGNLTEVLDRLSGTIRARLNLAATIRVLSAEGRMSAWILSLLPVVLVLLINFVNPRFMSVLWSDPAGIAAVWAGVSMLVAGIAWMVRMVKMRV
jgi:tight adherence protein B